MNKYRINKLPFFLWFSQSIDVELNKKKMKIKIFGETVRLAKTPKWVIFLLKHLPLLWILSFGLDNMWYVVTNYPIGFTLGLLMAAFIVFVFIKAFDYIFYAALIVSAGAWIAILKFNLTSQMHAAGQTWIFTFLLILVLVDIYFLIKRDEYYYIKDYFQRLKMSYKKFPIMAVPMPGFFIKEKIVEDVKEVEDAE